MWIDVDDRCVFAHDGAVHVDDGRLVLLVHGAGNDHSIWRYQTRRLAAAGYRALAIDLPGHGKSDGPGLTSIRDMADWVGRVIDALGSPETVVVGHSMGTIIALELAARRPLAGIGLMAPAVPMEVHEDLQRAADDEDALARDLIIGWSFNGRARFGSHLDPGVWTAGGNRRLLERSADLLGTDLRACAEWEAPELEAIDVPALVIVGSEDRMTPAKAGRSVAERLPQATLVYIENGSHVAVYHRPREVNRALESWLSGL